MLPAYDWAVLEDWRWNISMSPIRAQITWSCLAHHALACCVKPIQLGAWDTRVWIGNCSPKPLTHPVVHSSIARGYALEETSEKKICWCVGPRHCLPASPRARSRAPRDAIRGLDTSTTWFSAQGVTLRLGFQSWVSARKYRLRGQRPSENRSHLAPWALPSALGATLPTEPPKNPLLKNPMISRG